MAVGRCLASSKLIGKSCRGAQYVFISFFFLCYSMQYRSAGKPYWIEQREITSVRKNITRSNAYCLMWRRMSFYGVITQLSQQNLWTLQLCMGMHSLSRACILENISISASSNIIQSLSLEVSGLNPNWANNFNGWMITHYFLLHQELEDKYDRIPQEHQWNMDEKGIQLGGGKKNDGDKLIFTCHQKEPYKIESNNLQLVTIIECVYVAGVAMPLSFILMDGPKPDTQRLLNESILRWQVFMKFWLVADCSYTFQYYTLSKWLDWLKYVSNSLWTAFFPLQCPSVFVIN